MIYPCANCTSHQQEIGRAIRQAERRRAKSLDTSAQLAVIASHKESIETCDAAGHPTTAASSAANKKRHARARDARAGV